MLFPADGRDFGAKRWLNISLRTLHLLASAGVGGGILLQAPKADWQPYLWLTLATGGCMLLMDLWSSIVHLIQIRGLAVLAKIALLACLPHLPEYQIHALVAIVVISGVVSHAPARVRYHSVFHGREVHTL